ncbi:MAG TPA: winged helix DNA-binding domain-containing protein [Bryobacteraceae bacterium]|nr:winged helix DNA-binding domain-containing protein [Bryobacteraceae bacterium]
MDGSQVNQAMTPKALNRALLARQMLLSRKKATALSVVERLVGLQAQQARPPFVGLWSRVEGFEREELLKLLTARKVVRATLMRGTLHLMSARDYLAFRPALQPMLSLGMTSVLRDRTKDLNVDEIAAVARKMFDHRPGTFAELRRHLANSFPNGDERAMGYAVRTFLPLVTTPDDATWGFRTDSSFALAESWIGKLLSSREQTKSLVLRYLEGFGPATAADVKTWSGLQGAQAILDALRPKLLVSRDERKRELFDLPQAPRPEEDTPAPPRFIAAFDNLVLSHADRSRIIPEEYRARIVTKNLQVLPTFLVDGFVAGTWESKTARNVATLTVSPFAPLAKPVKAQLSEEAERLVRFVEPEATKFEVTFA